jgi:O-antigen/teichoic acid export membrane protein
MFGMPPAMLLVFLVNVFAAAQRPAAGAGLNLMFLVLGSMGAVAGAYAGGLTGMFVTSVGVAVGSTVAALVWIRRALGISVVAAHTGILRSLRAQPEIMGYAACFYTTLLGYMVTLLVARTVVISALGEAAGGWLHALLSIALALGAILTALINLYLAPLVNRRGSADEKTAVTGDFAARILVLLLIGALPVLLFPGIVMRMMFRADFVPAAELLWWFVLWQGIVLIANSYQQLLVGLDDVVFIALSALASYGATIAVMAPLVDASGIAGIGQGLCGGGLLHFALLTLRVRVRHGGHVPPGVLMRLAGLSAIVVAAHLAFAGRSEVGAAAVAARVLFGAAALVLAWLALDRAERDPRALIAALRGGRAGSTGP